MLKHFEQTVRHNLKAADIKAGTDSQRDRARAIKDEAENKFNELLGAVQGDKNKLDGLPKTIKAIGLLTEIIVRRGNEDQISEGTINQADRDELEEILGCDFAKDIQYTDDPVKDADRILKLLQEAKTSFDAKYRAIIGSHASATPHP